MTRLLSFCKFSLAALALSVACAMSMAAHTDADPPGAQARMHEDGRGSGMHETGRYETGRYETGRHEPGRRESGRHAAGMHASRAGYEQAAARISKRAASLRAGGRRAKNVILFIGDGMGVSTVTAARILEGQNKGGHGEENALSFDAFDNAALIKTYSVDQQTADSAPTATAIMTGYKVKGFAISVGPEVSRLEGDYAKIEPYVLETLLERAEARGLSTGIVSTARVTHATPAANYAHTPNRDWERAGQLPADATVLDIAAQLIERQKKGNGIEVVLGGGREMFLPATQADPEYPEQAGRRTDGRDLSAEWAAAQPRSAYVWNKADFDVLDTRKISRLLGLFEPSHMRFEADRADDAAGEPSLAEMTRKSIELLSRNRKGFYLMVEAGRIDHAHHAGNAYRALTDTIALSDAVRVAMQATDPRDTLILVTADHSHTMTIAGYPRRGNPILGLARAPGEKGFSRDHLGHPYTTIGYANGRGYAFLEVGGETRYGFPIAAGRAGGLSSVDTTDQGFHQEALVGLIAETHGGEDVPLYAHGAGSNLVGGTMEQNEIYHVMRAALGL